MKLYLSASSIKDYLICPQRFYYRINKSKEAEQTTAMNVGSLVHALLERENEWTTDEEGIKLAEQLLDQYDLSDYDVNDFLPYIKTFNKYYREMLSDKDLIEFKFKFQFKDDVFIVGKFDRILYKYNAVIDWKTTKRPPNSIDNDIQFILYYEAYKRIFNKAPSAVLYASLYNYKLIPYRRSISRIENLFDVVIPKIINDYNTNSFYTLGLYNNSCANCSFKSYCFEQLGIRKNELGS